MMRQARFLYLTLLISIAHGIGMEDKKGPLGPRVLEVPEATPVPYPVYQFTSRVEGVCFYYVSGETEGKISISSDGWLYLEQPLEWSHEKSHHLKIEARSADDEVLDGPYSVVLQVMDVNNNEPIFTESQYQAQVQEHSPAGVPFLRVFATDKDDPKTQHARLRFSIEKQIPNPSNIYYFGINPDSGEIFITEEGHRSLRSRPAIKYSRGEVRGNPDVLRRKFEDFCLPRDDADLENNPFYSCVVHAESRQRVLSQDPDYVLIVRVEDQGDGAQNALSSSTRVDIVVLQNLWINRGPISIKENLQGEYPRHITSVQSNDPNALYRLVQKERDLFPFTINRDGDIFVTCPLDREEKSMYILVVIAEDNQGVELEKPMEIVLQVVDENDSPPVCENTVFEVQENEPIGNVVGILPVNDADEEDSINSMLTFKFLSQTPTNPSDKMFTIQQSNGVIQILNDNFNRRAVPQYVLNYIVSDQDFSTECSAIIKVIDINNEIPIFETNDYGTFSIPELTEVGTTLLIINATDGDHPGTGSSKVVYSIVNGDPETHFAIEVDEASGAGRVYVAKPLDYEHKSVYNLQIFARNPEPLIDGVEYDHRSTAAVIIQLVDEDEPPVFELDVLSANIPENITIGTTILMVKAKDPEGKTIRFKLEGDEQGWLDLDSNSGELKTRAALDREILEKLTLKVIAYETEGDKQQAEMTVNIHLLDVNDNYPHLQPKQGFFCLGKFTPLTLTAVDIDGEPFAEPFTFSITRKSPNFEIKPVDGSSAQLILKKKPTTELNTTLPISVLDNAGMGISHRFDVHICNCTSFGYCFIKPEAHGWKLGMGSTIGILGGVLGFIALFLLIVMYRIKNNQKKAAASEEDKPML